VNIPMQRAAWIPESGPAQLWTRALIRAQDHLPNAQSIPAIATMPTPRSISVDVYYQTAISTPISTRRCRRPYRLRQTETTLATLAHTVAGSTPGPAPPPILHSPRPPWHHSLPRQATRHTPSPRLTLASSQLISQSAINLALPSELSDEGSDLLASSGSEGSSRPDTSVSWAESRNSSFVSVLDKEQFGEYIQREGRRWYGGVVEPPPKYAGGN
jgi:hypothetical protein